jgi:hypothetical protein
MELSLQIKKKLCGRQTFVVAILNVVCLTKRQQPVLL